MLRFSYMKLLATLFGIKQSSKRSRKTIKDYQQEVLLKQGKEQIKKLLDLGRIPVTLL